MPPVLKSIFMFRTWTPITHNSGRNEAVIYSSEKYTTIHEIDHVQTVRLFFAFFSDLIKEFKRKAD